jgi:hypothetical protein
MKQRLLVMAARSQKSLRQNLLAVAQAVFFAKRNQSRFDIDSIDFVFLLEVGMKVLIGQERANFCLMHSNNHRRMDFSPRDL